MLANLFISVVKIKIKRKWAFCLVPVTRQQMINCININFSLRYAEGSWQVIIKENHVKYQNSLFSERNGAYF